MSTVFYSLQERSKGRVTRPLLLWAFLMAIDLFCYEAQIGNSNTVRDAGLLITVVLGIYLGWQRRSGTVFIAPLVSWIVAWPPLWLATMIHEGFFKGFFKGLFLITIGWIAIGAAEFAVLLITSTIVRMLRGKKRDNVSEVVVFGPDDTVQ